VETGRIGQGLWLERPWRTYRHCLQHPPPVARRWYRRRRVHNPMPELNELSHRSPLAWQCHGADRGTGTVIYRVQGGARHDLFLGWGQERGRVGRRRGPARFGEAVYGQLEKSFVRPLEMESQGFAGEGPLPELFATEDIPGLSSHVTWVGVGPLFGTPGG
jgi:hypothetical protein